MSNKRAQPPGRPWVKGQSGNPSGRRPEGPSPEALRKLARSHAPECLETLLEVMRRGRSDSARITAADLLLNRAYGRAVLTPLEGEAAPVQITVLLDDARKALRKPNGSPHNPRRSARRSWTR